MFELSVACKYLIPRRRQLSVSIISLVSTLIIALVVWLIVVFFSVKDGLENGWINKIIALTAPVRITPTEEYYKSYYYLADSVSAQSDYTSKSIGEKLKNPQVDPYDPNIDEELPSHWNAPDRYSNGKIKDLVKIVFETATSLGLHPTDFEMAATNIHLELFHNPSRSIDIASYIGTFDADNPVLTTMLLKNTESKIDAKFLASVSTTGFGITLPKDVAFGEAVLLPESFKKGGVFTGDQGYVSYLIPTPSSVQEQRIPIYVAGFYDPGIISIGGKFILAHQSLTAAIRSSISPEDSLMSNGINVRFLNFNDAPKIKAKLYKAFENEGMSKYWHIETYQEYDFTKDLIQQLQSEKNLFALISLIIIIVACSNIISMLIILVNDKKLEIGILRSMGASSSSIAAIFGLCGVVMGATGSIIGATAAIFTLKYINELVQFISKLQGYDLFNPVFYGAILPSQLSLESLSFVIFTTASISLVAGIIPAIKASMLRPSTILRAE